MLAALGPFTISTLDGTSIPVVDWVPAPGAQPAPNLRALLAEQHPDGRFDTGQFSLPLAMPEDEDEDEPVPCDLVMAALQLLDTLMERGTAPTALLCFHGPPAGGHRQWDYVGGVGLDPALILRIHLTIQVQQLLAFAWLRLQHTCSTLAAHCSSALCA